MATEILLFKMIALKSQAKVTEIMKKIWLLKPRHIENRPSQAPWEVSEPTSAPSLVLETKQAPAIPSPLGTSSPQALPGAPFPSSLSFWLEQKSCPSQGVSGPSPWQPPPRVPPSSLLHSEKQQRTTDRQTVWQTENVQNRTSVLFMFMDFAVLPNLSAP